MLDRRYDNHDVSSFYQKIHSITVSCITVRRDWWKTESNC